MKPNNLLNGTHSFTIRFDGVERSYTLHIPISYSRKAVMPLLLMLHGAGDSAKGAIEQTNLITKSENSHFFVAFPEGLPLDPSIPPRSRHNPRVWNSGFPYVPPIMVDDVGFINAVIDDIGSKVAIDKKRIFATGFSSGACMAFRLGIEISDRIAAIATVADHCLLLDRQMHRPVSLLFIMGADDPLNPINGGTVKGIWDEILQRPAVMNSISIWAKMIGCPIKPEYICKRGGVSAIAYRGCLGDQEIIYYRVSDLGHNWPGGKARLPVNVVGKMSNKIKANNVIWDFFEKHPIK